jgi:membrane-associated phospholipid phosphatase
MAIEKHNLTPKIDAKALKSFGLMMTWAFPLFIGIIAPWLIGLSLQWWTLWVSIFFISLALIAPKLLYWPYKVWMFVAGIIGFINTRLLLGATFYLIIFPIGVVLKLTHKLQFKKTSQQHSNYVVRHDKITKTQLEQPF